MNALYLELLGFLGSRWGKPLRVIWASLPAS